jgi:hypothetical protein
MIETCTKQKIQKFVTTVIYASGLFGAAICGSINAYKRGYEHGKEDADKSWHAQLIDVDYAEYERKTGKWKLRSMEDVLMAGTILGRVKPEGWFPEPGVDSKEVKQQLKSGKKP